ncbi:MAG: peptidase S41 [Coxiella sp. (in: Bacteria)]|nr:MAG: peptidase S41 [Coxiella sp. (in: g-proteobacteria)]
MLKKVSGALLGSLVSMSSLAIPTPPPGLNIPRQEIQQFVTSIAVIKHYYIKDVPDKKLFAYAIKGMLSNLDPHSAYLDATALKNLQAAVSGKFVGVGIELTIKDGILKVITPLEGTPAFKAGIKPNDLIIKVGDKLVQNMTLQEAINNIKGKRGTNVKLTIVRIGSDKPIVKTVKRDIIKVVMVKNKMLEKGFGYIRIAMFQGPVTANLHKAINKLEKDSGGRLKGLILDLRNNPGGLLQASAGVADTFLNANKLNKKYHGLLVYTKGRIKGSDVKFKAHPGDMIDGTPLVVLINGGSASASEIVAGALQDYKRAIIMGTRSFGKGSVQTVIPINKTTAIKITTALYYTPNGSVIQARGIIPDVSVPALEVSDKNLKNLIKIDESDYQNHLVNGEAKLETAKLKKLKERRKKELTLAKDDYQMYEALMMLKGMNALN